MSALSNPIFHDAEAAREWLEAHPWPDARTAVFGAAYKMHNISVRRLQVQGKGAKQFTVTVGTVFERSHIPLNKWLIALH